MKEDVLAANRYLKETMKDDKDVVITAALLAEVIYRMFRYVDISGKSIDKELVPDWREKLAGQHSGGNTISYCSNISIRKLQEAAKFSHTLFQLAQIETELKRQAGLTSDSLGISDFTQTFLNTLILSLNYDRRFIPPELPRSQNKTHVDFIKTAFDEAFAVLSDKDALETSIVTLQEYREAHSSKRKSDQEKLKRRIEGEREKDIFFDAVYDVIKRQEEIDAEQAMTEKLLELALAG
jgi:hypothetical protein